MSKSVAMSTAEVASSKMSTFGRERMARARQSSCFCPWERLLPEEAIGEESERKGFLFSIGWEGSIAVVDVAAEDSASSGFGVCVVDGIRCTRISASPS